MPAPQPDLAGPPATAPESSLSAPLLMARASQPAAA
nr:MAG TPA: hypothetical protein [Caudoviricetes sp.]